MFEKEAEDWVKTKGTDAITCIKENIGWDDVCEQAFIAGAEFGYDKANKWHYTKDGEYPKENQLVLLYRENPNGANVALSYWYKSYVNDKVIAWKEVTPPKE